MSPERLVTLRLRWGLVSLGALAFITTRFAVTFLDQWLGFRLRTDWRVLSSRLSQLKPFIWKASYSGTYFVLLLAMLTITIVVMLVIGIRDALTTEKEP